MTLPQNQSPYNDDFDPQKNFYQVLFKPAVSVQVRELNQLQSILQDQINKFGDNIFKTGTIISGCHITYHNPFPFVKINDQETNGTTVDVNRYKNLNIKNSTNLKAVIVEAVGGYELQTPDLNTLYLKYINSGDSGTEVSFQANQTLTIYNSLSPISSVSILNGSSGFSNTDAVIISPALAVQNSSGGKAFSNGFYVGDYISNGRGANVKITNITSSNNDYLIINYLPQANDLTTENYTKWTINSNNTIVDANTSETATVVSLVGSEALLSITTNYVGTISNVSIVSAGSGYEYSPTVSVKSQTANSSQIASLSLSVPPYVTQVTTANTLNSPIGSGYAVTVSEGIIYQKGYFQRVEEQLVIVDKYSNSPDQIVAGFDTSSEIINSNIDTSLLDNSFGEPNELAPGADRLKLTPTFVILDKETAKANNDFLTIVEFAQGLPYSQNIQTQYNIIEKELAQRTFEESGNFVLDRFSLTTLSPADFTSESNNFTITIDPGTAYINGYRVSTQTNYSIDVPKGTNTTIANTSTISMNFGNYIRVTNVGGTFDVGFNATVNLYSTAAGFNPRNAITAPSGLIGTARVRSLVLDDQINNIYKVYLYDIEMTAGQNFRSVRSIYTVAEGTLIADVILDNGNCILYDNNLSSLVFPTGVNAIKSVNNAVYISKKTSTTASANTSGICAITESGSLTFPYTGQLSTAQEKDIIIVPVANLVSSVAYPGTFTANTTSNVVTGSGTSFTSLNVGDYLRVANTTANTFGRITQIANDTYLTMDANNSLAISANGYLFFPQRTPISLAPSTRTVNVSSNSTLLTVDFGTGFAAAANVYATYNVKVSGALTNAKTVNRDLFVRIKVSNNVAGTSGPWCLGVSDIFRMKNVYKGSNNTFTANSAGVVDVTSNFYIDHNQNQDFYNNGYLYSDPQNPLTLSNTDVLLVKFDAFTSGSIGFSIKSYPVNDQVKLANAVTTINTLEIPEVFGTKGEYYDLRDCVDLRPQTINSATITSAAGSATINPVESVGNTRFAELQSLFPSPDSTLTLDLVYYNGRSDTVTISNSGKFNIITNASNNDIGDSIVVSKMNIPPYPTLPSQLSIDEARYLYTGISNGKALTRRANTYTISYEFANTDLSQPKPYTMKQIGELERRIKNLEYYVSFTLTEALAKSRVIPSSSNSAIDRFKFGFFVDNFDDNRYSDFTDPAFNCQFANSYLVPATSSIKINYSLRDKVDNGGDNVNFLYTEYPLISQLQATSNTVLPANTGSTAGSNTNIICSQQTNVVQINNQNIQYNGSGSAFEISEFYMSADSGPVTIYFNFRDSRNGLQVFQGTTSGFDIAGKVPIIDAGSATSPSTYEKNTYYQGLGKLEGLEFPGPLAGQPTVYNDGKLVFTHNPVNGRYYRIKLTKFNYGARDRHYRIYYPIDNCVEKVVTPVPKTVLFNYSGSIVQIDPATFSTVDASQNQAFTIRATGLKPSTSHNFIFNGLNYTSACVQEGFPIGSLKTDTSGTVQFQFFYQKSFVNNGAGNIASAKSIAVSSVDGTSIAVGTIGIKSYVSLYSTPSTLGVVDTNYIGRLINISEFSLK